MIEKQYIKLTIILLAISFALASCEKEKDDPRVVTTAIELQVDQTYNLRANVLDKGDYPILDYGFEYAYGNSSYGYFGITYKKSLGKVISGDTFSSNLEVDYTNDQDIISVRAYITNKRGTAYGKAIISQLPRARVLSIYPNTAAVGDTITINGENFRTNLSTIRVSFSSCTARVLSATTSQIRVIVPLELVADSYSTYITLYVYFGSQSLNINSAFVLAPTLTSFSPQTGTWNNNITIYGKNLIETSVYFDNTLISNNEYYSNSYSVSIPTSFVKKRFKIYVQKQGVKREVPGGYFTMNNISASFTPQITYLPSTSFSFQATNANPTYNSNFLLLGTTKILNTNYSGSTLQFVIPPQMAEGEYICKLSNYIDTIILAPKLKVVKPYITGLTLTSGLPGTSLTIQGNYFINTGINPSIYFDPASAYGTITSYDSTKINVKVPWIAPGTYSIKALFGSFTANSPQQFTVLEPTISSITPSSGVAGTSVIIDGQGFGTTYTAIVYFGNLSSTAVSQTNTQINVKVPSGITSGTWLVKVKINGYELSNTTTFVVP